jgi:UDPglucose 6-dehydrogenase
MRIGVIGVGSIGTVLARGFDELGHDVVINDVDADRERAIEFPAASVPEIGATADMAVLAVPTPTGPDGGDASQVEQVVRELRGADATVVIRSTMPPKETRRIADKYKMDLLYSPEFLRDRSDVSDFFEPDRIVIAGPAHERGVLKSVMDHPLVQCTNWIEMDDYLPAEIGKEAHNAFFATKVSFANQMRMIAEAAGADPKTVMDIVTADRRTCASHLDPMLGPYGGMCLPKDTEALTHFAKAEDAPTAQLDATMWINDIARERYENLDITGNWPQIDVVAPDGR